ncbi:hypothetical protein GCM10010124_26140 [Pilimelia terevasa]|uniref:Uncharacterized protein n=1 Tax=Pilimelia terevasa TaxID=53372 RepID=A0A8J3BMF5_9ACTN|nr:hypothetical protein [Pilimelia terevasa]GGK32132.1 hypothetical protein GCM10010124_26140 [Pilimelia terevasa]
MSSIKAEGQQTATLTTEHTLLDTSDAGNYQLKVDTTNLAGAEYVDLKIYDKAKTGGSYRLVQSVRVAAGAAYPISESVPLTAPLGAKFTLTQTGGTGRSFDWSVVQLDA